LGAGEEEGGGGVAEEGEDGVFGLLPQLVVVGSGQRADYQLFHLVHPWRNSKNIIRRQKREERQGRMDGGNSMGGGVRKGGGMVGMDHMLNGDN
jgi:hypothetical protein